MKDQTRLASESTSTEPIRATYSSMTLHRRCPAAWKFKYLDRLEPEGAGDSPALGFGSWFHAVRAADRLAKGRSEGTLLVETETLETVDGGPTFDGDVPAGAVLEAAARWWDALPEETREDWTAWLGWPLPRRLTHAYEGWRERWAEESRRESVLAVEYRWERPLAPKTAVSGRPVYLFGFVDEVYEDRRRGLVVVRDCKTSKTLGAMSVLDEMMDSQVQVYAWGLGPVCRKWGAETPRAVSFDRVRSAAPKTPQVTKSGRLSKAVTDYDLRTYLEWVEGGVEYPGLKKDGSGAGTYTVEKSEVERLSSSEVCAQWFRRTLTPVSRNVLRSHLQAAVDTVSDMERTRARAGRSAEAPRNLVMQTCKFCDFADLCRAQMVGGARGEYDLADFGLRRRAGHVGR